MRKLGQGNTPKCSIPTSGATYHSAKAPVHYTGVEATGGAAKGEGPARSSSTFGKSGLPALTEPAPALAGGDHYREIAGKLRELARSTRSPGIRQELVDLARRYDRRGDHFDRRSSC
jgi:hypothetical protein